MCERAIPVDLLSEYVSAYHKISAGPHLGTNPTGKRLEPEEIRILYKAKDALFKVMDDGYSNGDPLRIPRLLEETS